MSITYDEKRKDLPNEPLHRLFMRVGWSDGQEPAELKQLFNLPFIRSNLVISAWDGDELVGVVRVIGDQTVRSEIFDLAVDPDYQGRGIGCELVRRCKAHWPKSEWRVETTNAIAGYYEKIGFTRTDTVLLTIGSEYF